MPPRQRTDLSYAFLHRLGEVRQCAAEQYFRPRGGAIEYRLLTRSVRDYSQPLISIGGAIHPEREMLFADPNNPLLCGFLDQVRDAIISNDTDATDVRLGIVAQRVRQLFQNRNVENVAALIANWQCERIALSANESVALIPIHYFMGEQTGACRHFSVLTALTLDYLQRQHLLDAGDIVHYRAELANQRSHAWIVFATESRELYFVDPSHRVAPGGVSEIYRESESSVRSLCGDAVWEDIAVNYTLSQCVLAPTQPLSL